MEKPQLVSHEHPTEAMVRLLDADPKCMCKFCTYRRGKAKIDGILDDARAWEASRKSR